MTRDILVYTLGCGCTDWCTCTPCGLGQPHEPGTTWNCDQHGRTTVTAHVAVPDLNTPVENGEIATVGSKDTFTLADDHPMRAVRCAVCALPIGDQQASVISVVALGGPGCTCGMIPSTAYLIHGTHLAMTPDQLMTHLETAMACQGDHPWGQ